MYGEDFDLTDTSTRRLTAPPLLKPGGHVLFLDFDGTLVEIAATPKGVEVPDGLTALLQDLHGAFGEGLVILTGRSIADMDTFLPQYKGNIIGQHGAQWRCNGDIIDQAARAAKLDALLDEAREFCAGDERLLVEEKEFGFAVHYRARPEMADAVRRFLVEKLNDQEELSVEPAKMAYEVKPATANKGSALTAYCRHIGLGARVPVHVGDDVSDQHAFRTATRLRGFGVQVGRDAPHARYTLTQPAAVRRWLEEVVQ